MDKRNIAYCLLLALICLVTSCTGAGGKKQRSAKEEEQLEIREITLTVENWAFHHNPSLFEEDAYKYFSEDLRRTVNDAIEESGDDMYLDFDPWSEGQDPDYKTRAEVTEVYGITDSTATVELTVTQWKTFLQKTLYLVYEDDKWLIDDLTIDQEGETLRQFMKK